jgi:hypothetical protein
VAANPGLNITPDFSGNTGTYSFEHGWATNFSLLVTLDASTPVVAGTTITMTFGSGVSHVQIWNDNGGQQLTTSNITNGGTFTFTGANRTSFRVMVFTSASAGSGSFTIG